MLHTFNEPPNSLRDLFSVCVLEVDWDPDRYLKEGEKKHSCNVGDEVKKNISNDITANIVVGKYILSILVKTKSRQVIIGENHGIRINQEIDCQRK